MMMNLFSSFDPCTGFMSLNWLSSFTFFFMLNYNFWLINNNMMSFYNSFLLKLNLELNLILNSKGSSLLFLSIMMMILFNNFLGLIPYIFTSSSHLTFSLSLALPLWFTFMIFGWMMKTNHMLIHLVPQGTPYILMPLMVLIETISNLIRPGSLAVRLSANMIAGHLLMTLLGSSMNLMMMLIFLLIFIMLMIFEMAVSVIQSYVFMTLLTLYSSEI